MWESRLFLALPQKPKTKTALKSNLWLLLQPVHAVSASQGRAERGREGVGRGRRSRSRSKVKMGLSVRFVAGTNPNAQAEARAGARAKAKAKACVSSVPQIEKLLELAVAVDPFSRTPLLATPLPPCSMRCQFYAALASLQIRLLLLLLIFLLPLVF